MSHSKEGESRDVKAWAFGAQRAAPLHDLAKNYASSFDR